MVTIGDDDFNSLQEDNFGNFGYKKNTGEEVSLVENIFSCQKSLIILDLRRRHLLKKALRKDKDFKHDELLKVYLLKKWTTFRLDSLLSILDLSPEFGYLDFSEDIKPIYKENLEIADQWVGGLSTMFDMQDYKTIQLSIELMTIFTTKIIDRNGENRN